MPPEFAPIVVVPAAIARLRELVPRHRVLGVTDPRVQVGADPAAGVETVQPVPEVVVARARGIRCLGVSAITNVAAGLSTSGRTSSPSA